METLSIKVHEATRDAIEGLRVTGGRIVSASAVGRRLIEQALSGGGVPTVELPSLDMMPDDLDVLRDTLDANEKPHAARTRALLQWYDEVCALLNQYPVPDYRLSPPVPVAPVVKLPVAVSGRGAVSR